MEFTIGDWRFQVNTEETFHHTRQNSLNHCKCAYCRNYYDTVPLAHPQLLQLLECFGVDYHGPSEVMPFLPTFVLTCYRVMGRILQFGSGPILAGEVPVAPETADEDSFFLWAGEMHLPWLQDEPEEEVVSPANLPDFMDRMEEVWLLRHGEQSIQS